MKLNTNSNSYTIIYSIVVVIIVAFLLAFVSKGLEERSNANERIDKKQQILAALNVRNTSKDSVEQIYESIVKQDLIVKQTGETVSTKDGFNVDRKDMTPTKLPFYICQKEGATKYVIPMVGKGLWGSIWGFVALNEDGKTIYGAYFSHESETAGLGSLIKDQPFQDQFQGKQAFSADGQVAVNIVKAGKVQNKDTEVDGITGATLTSNGVNAMVQEYLKLYAPTLAKLCVPADTTKAQ